MSTDLAAPVITAIRRYQTLPDPDLIRVVLAVAATAHLDGEPVWLQVVGAPSSGKSEAIAVVADTADGTIGDVSLAGLLGWSGSATKGRPTGLLSRIGDGNKLITISDFSTVIADSDRGRRATLFAFLRPLYDGHVSRDIGTAPRRLEWSGRLTVVSAVTPQIDRYSAHADSLGPRWLYVRVVEPSADERKRAARAAHRHATDKAEHRACARALAANAVERARRAIGDQATADGNGRAIEDAALLATLLRSDVPRDGYGKREIIGLVSREEPARMTIVLEILFRGLRALGVSAPSSRRIVLRCALDSTPLARRRAVVALKDGEVIATKQVARRMSADYHVAMRALEELQLLGVVVGVPPSKPGEGYGWALCGDDGTLARDLLAGGG
jgi:hypothetical protein